jgi:hypothetical protein
MEFFLITPLTLFKGPEFILNNITKELRLYNLHSTQHSLKQQLFLTILRIRHTDTISRVTAS